MKKFLVFAMILVSACVLLSADELLLSKASMNIKVGVTPINEAKWLDYDSATNLSETTWDSKESISDEYLTKEKNSVSLYPSAITNYNGNVQMKVTGTALTNSKTVTKISLTADSNDAVSGQNSAEWESDTAGTAILWKEAKDTYQKEGKRVLSHQLTITMDMEDYNNALAADEYVSTLTLSIEAD